MRQRARYDAVVVGAGPNGLAAAIVLGGVGLSVVVREAGDVPGGEARSAELTLDGYRHDLCSTIYAFGAMSPLFRAIPLSEYGLEWHVRLLRGTNRLEIDRPRCHAR